MSRQPRAGTAGKQRSFRVTAVEWLNWMRAAEVEGCETVSAWAVRALNERAARVAPPKRSKR